jgi:D-glycero-D-manno-heptose 1,7-bisphosphate phosphatase
MAQLEITQAVILAGGIGSRLRPLTYTTPKPLVSINGRPFLEYLLELLKRNGISEIVLLLGYRHEKIRDHFGDGSNFGLKIKYSLGDVAFRTGKRIKNAQNLVHKRFMLLYCDNYWPLDLQRLIRFHDRNRVDATVTVYANEDGSTRNNMYVDQSGYVIKYDKSRSDNDLNGVEIGYYILDEKVINLMPDDNFSFEKEILPRLIAARQLAGFHTEHKYYSIGSLERLPQTERFLRPKKVVFLDRDGVINRKAPKAAYVRSWREFVFLPGVIQAIALLTKHHYKIFIVTNQAGIARGLMTEQDLKRIHIRMKDELARHDAKIEGIYFCPHGWDEGCKCRKPKAGMFYQAARDHDLDLTKTYFIGDDERDLAAGNAAGCRTFLADSEMSLLRIAKEKLLT